ncbi:MAG TPA: hypothetical protein PLJ24_03655 [Anaerolineae bacterium]|nr:hypothetical protein [Anaerolineae bacterium]HQE99708.1 hypothetical protein [Anaerolineae bacterium]HQJ10900.1 hypothetical protein [Anaerolineae bacterium]
MSNITSPNLDRLAAQHAQAIISRTTDKKAKASEVDNTVTKALGVLQENGVYACFLYLLAKEGKNGAVVVAEMLDLLDGLGFGWGKPTGNSLEEVLSYISEKVTVDLERLLLAKETLEQMLIYARYGAKARG